MTIMETQNNSTLSTNRPPIARNITENGKLITWIDNPLTYLRKSYEQYGDIFRIGSEQNSITVLGGIEANQLLASESRELLSSNDFWSETLVEMNCPHSFIGVDDEIHRYQRRLMGPMFSKVTFKDNIPELSKTFKSILNDQFGEEETFISPFLRHTLSTQIGSALQGYAPTNEEVESLIEYQATVMNACSFKRTSRKVLQSESYLKSKQMAHDLADRIIASEPSDPEKPRYIDVLVKEGSKNRPEWFTPGDIRNHAIIPFLAGIDTVTSALSFSIRELLLNPELQRELTEEVSHLDLHNPTLSVINDMTKVDLFIKEVLRLYPPAFAVYRMATNDFEFQNYKINKGETLIFFISACHTDERYFSNPYKFDINRFTDLDLDRGVYAPFGKGPHTCVGSSLSNIMLPLNLATLLHYANFEYKGDIRNLALDFTKPSLSLDPDFAISFKPSNNQL